MNTKLSASGRPVVIAEEKITKKQVDQALAEGKTHVKFTSNKVQRRLLKQQQKIRRQQEIRENQTKALNKAQKAAKGTRPVGGGIGLAHPQADMVRKTGTAHFIDKSGKSIPVSHEEAQQIAKAFEEQPEEEEEDLTGAPGPEYTYQPHNGEEEPSEGVGYKLVDQFSGMGPIVKIEGEVLADPPAEVNIPADNDDYVFSADIGVKVVDEFTGMTEDGLILTRSTIAPLDMAFYKELRERELSGVSLNPFEYDSSDGRTAMFAKSLPTEVSIPRVSILRNQALINLYGDENNYKPFPEIGDTIRDDGLMMAVRTFDDVEPAIGRDLAALREVDYVHDKLYYGVPGAKIIAIADEGQSNVEAMREGLEKAGLLKKPTEH